MKTLFTFQFWVFLKQLPVNGCASGEMVLSDDYLVGFPNSLLQVPCADGCFYLVFCFSSCEVLGKAALAFATQTDGASQLSKPVLLDWLLCFPESFPVEEKKALINCSSCGSWNKGGFWWTLHKWEPTVKQNLSHSVRIGLTKVGEIHLDSFLEVLDLKLKKAISILQHQAHIPSGLRIGWYIWKKSLSGNPYEIREVASWALWSLARCYSIVSSAT